MAEIKQLKNKTIIGHVSSAKMDKTVVVKVVTKKRDKNYPKLVKVTQTFKAHDEKNIAKEGDKVKIVSARPLSKTKRYRLVEVIPEKY